MQRPTSTMEHAPRTSLSSSTILPMYSSRENYVTAIAHSTSVVSDTGSASLDAVMGSWKGRHASVQLTATLTCTVTSSTAAALWLLNQVTCVTRMICVIWVVGASSTLVRQQAGNALSISLFLQHHVRLIFISISIAIFAK
jgi:hypothetical protein